jgi:Flp pilus assembly pilin Flp
MNRINKYIVDKTLFLMEESGQGITEYGAVLAFVATLISCIMAWSNGGLLRAWLLMSFVHAYSWLTNLVRLSA